VLIRKRKAIVIKKLRWHACIPCAIRKRGYSGVFTGSGNVCTCGRRLLRTDRQIHHSIRKMTISRHKRGIVILPPVKLHKLDKALGLKGHCSRHWRRPQSVCSGCGEKRIVYISDWDDPMKDILCYPCGQSEERKRFRKMAKMRKRPRIVRVRKL